jgi:putative addiction module killer protein
MDVRHYLTPQGADLFQDWLDELVDLKGRIAVLRRIDRLARGNFGDYKFIAAGVWELRIDCGPGYRVYFGRQGKDLVLLLCGGSKRSQGADIADAVSYWADYRRRVQ